MIENGDDTFTKLAHANICELNNILQVYKSVNISSEDKSTLIKLQKQISRAIEEANDIIQPRMTMKVSALLNKSDKFSRKRFYSRASPFNNKKDKSHSFRIVPPMTFKKEPSPPIQARRAVTSQLLLSNLHLLENLSNLERIGGGKSET